MLEIRLHGPLAKQFGRIYHLDVRSPAEAVHALSVLRPEFRQAIMQLDRMGLVFRVRTKSHDFGETDLVMATGANRLDIIPIVRGAGARTRFVVGAVLFVASFWAGPFAPYLASLGISLMLGSVVEWLTPVPKQATQGKGLQSWVINGPTNTVDQGNPVPVVYGEVLTGGYTVSAGVSAGPVTYSNSTGTAYVIIGGDVTGLAYRYAQGQSQTLELLLTAGSMGPSGPLNAPIYTWTISGFGGASYTKTLEGSSVRIKVVAPPSSNVTDVFTATVTLGVASTPYSGDTNTYTATASTTVTATFGQPPAGYHQG